jgi:hypothetical protein
MPGLAFAGVRHLAFVRTIGGRDELIHVHVRIEAGGSVK